MKTNSASVLID